MLMIMLVKMYIQLSGLVKYKKKNFQCYSIFRKNNLPLCVFPCLGGKIVTEREDSVLKRPLLLLASNTLLKENNMSQSSYGKTD